MCSLALLSAWYKYRLFFFEATDFDFVGGFHKADVNDVMKEIFEWIHLLEFISHNELNVGYNFCYMSSRLDVNDIIIFVHIVIGV